MTEHETGPTFCTPDVLPSGQTGWTVNLGERNRARRYYRALRQQYGRTREYASLRTAAYLDSIARY